MYYTALRSHICVVVSSLGVVYSYTKRAQLSSTSKVCFEIAVKICVIQVVFILYWVEGWGLTTCMWFRIYIVAKFFQSKGSLIDAVER